MDTNLLSFEVIDLSEIVNLSDGTGVEHASAATSGCGFVAGCCKGADAGCGFVAGVCEET